MKILLTGFEPFGGEQINPSWEAMDALPLILADMHIAKLRLPVSFRRAPLMAIEAIHREEPDAVICLGQAGGRACVSIERIAVNLANAKNPDADGFKPVNRPIIAGGPDSLRSTLPTERLAEAVKNCGIPCELSDSAGRYVCNTLLYSLLHHFPALPIGFIHLPFLPEQAAIKGSATPSMSINDMTAAIRAIIAACKDF